MFQMLEPAYYLVVWSLQAEQETNDGNSENIFKKAQPQKANQTY